MSTSIRIPLVPVGATVAAAVVVLLGVGCRPGPSRPPDAAGTATVEVEAAADDDGDVRLEGDREAAPEREAPDDAGAGEAPEGSAPAGDVPSGPGDAAETAGPASAGAGAPDAAPVAPDGDVVVEARNLGHGDVEHAFDVADACPLGRVELDVVVDGMPDGFVVLRAPSGRSVRLNARWLQVSLLRTWDWASLDELHGERGTAIRGVWSFEGRLAGAAYSQPSTGETAPMPEPDIARVRLRFYCEPPAGGTRTGSPDVAGGGWSTTWEPRAGGTRPDADARALLAVSRDCAVGAMTVGAALGLETGPHPRVRIVAPDGTVHRVGRVDARADGGGGRRAFETRLALPETTRSAGIWELAIADGGAGILQASLGFECAGP